MIKTNKRRELISLCLLWFVRLELAGFLGLCICYICVFGKEIEVFDRGLKIGTPISVKHNVDDDIGMYTWINVYVEQFDLKSGLATVAVSLHGAISTNNECSVYRNAINSNPQDVVYTLEYLHNARLALYGTDARKQFRLPVQNETPSWCSVGSIFTETHPVRIEIPLLSDTYRYPFDRYEFNESFKVYIQMTNGQQKMSVPVTSSNYMLENHLLGAGWNLRLITYKGKNNIEGGSVVALVRSRYAVVLTITVLVIVAVLTLIVAWIVLYASREDYASGWNPAITVSTCVFAMFTLRSFVTPSDITSFTLFDGAMILLAFLQVVALSVTMFGRGRFVIGVDSCHTILETGGYQANLKKGTINEEVAICKYCRSEITTDVSATTSHKPASRTAVLRKNTETTTKRRASTKRKRKRSNKSG